jgi:circadian clock protein KaiB
MKAKKQSPVGRAKARAGLSRRRIKYAMRLYVTGATPKSSRAISNLRKLCDEYLPGQYELQVIDVYQQPKLAREGQIIAAPTLVKSFPLPLRRFIGDMSNTKNLLTGLEIRPAPAREGSES